MVWRRNPFKKLTRPSTPEKSNTKRQGIEPNTIAQIISSKSRFVVVFLLWMVCIIDFYCTLSFKIQFQKHTDKLKVKRRVKTCSVECH